MELDASLVAMVGDGASESEVALRFILFVGGSIAIIYLMNKIFGKLIGEGKKKSTANSYFNDLHKKWDKIVSVGSSFVLLVIVLVFWNTDLPTSTPLYLLIAAIAILPILVQLGFERKYAENPNEYLYTLLGVGISGVIIFTLLVILSPGF